MINQEEYEVLRDYYFRSIMWISRNENGDLVVSKIKPDKFERKWLPQCLDEDWSELRNSETDLFLFIQWEDKEPYEIAELIEEYESKEKEVKKRGIIEKIKYLAREVSQQLSHEEMVELLDVLREIDQLDEPEVLSQDKKSGDLVNHPDHYNKGGIETLDIIKMSLTKEEYKGYLKGNILKYRERAQFKGNAEQDYAKARFYFDEWEGLG